MAFSRFTEKGNPNKPNRGAALLLTLLLLLSALCAACGGPADSGKPKDPFIDLGNGDSSDISTPPVDLPSEEPSDAVSDGGDLSTGTGLSPDKLTLSGHTVDFGEYAEPLLAFLGEYTSVELLSVEAQMEENEESPAVSCEKLYHYNGFLVHTYPDGDLERLASIILDGDEAPVSAEQGSQLQVGMSENDLLTLLQGGKKQGNGSYLLRGGDAMLQIFVSAGQVTMARYTDATYAAQHDPGPLILLSDITTEVENSVAYREYIRILDLQDGMIDLYDESKVHFDSSSVNIAKQGSYPLTITVENSAGKSRTRGFTVQVVPKIITEEMAYALAEEILADRTQSSMTNEEKLQAVFQYITKESGMQYVDTSNKDNPYYLEAYYGFTNHRGDCYTYCSMSQVLLDCLDVDYFVVTRNGERRSNHYWLLADFGDGWYHFDTCYHAYRWTKPTYKLTDAEVAAFTDWYNKKAHGWNYYQFDHSLYPPTPVLNADGSYTYQSYTVTYTAGEGGSISGAAQQQVQHGHSSTIVTAAPAPGYVFRRWSDGYPSVVRTDLITGDMEVTAEFVPASE